MSKRPVNHRPGNTMHGISRHIAEKSFYPREVLNINWNKEKRNRVRSSGSGWSLFKEESNPSRSECSLFDKDFNP